MKTYTVRIFAHLPASATMQVTAKSEQAAIEYALDNYGEANWDGADYSTPDGSMIESAEVYQ